MKKKVLIGLGIFVLVIVIGMIYLNYRNRTLSPPGIANFSKEGLYFESNWIFISSALLFNFATSPINLVKQ